MSVSPVRTLIVDDEPLARAGLRRLLSEVSWVHCVGESHDGEHAVAQLELLCPELVFLDIQMPGLSGLDVLRRSSLRPRVVFTTAYAQHAVEAFELGALDYLLKPFGAERLGSALDRVRSSLGEPVAAGDRLSEALAQGPMTRFFVRAGRAIVPLRADEVVRMEAAGDYVAIHAGGGPYLMHLALDRLEARLDPRRFVRIHRSHLVNLDFVSAFVTQADGNIQARLRDGSALPVSRHRARALRGLVE